MRKATIIRRKSPLRKELKDKDIHTSMIDHSKELLKHPVVKGAAFIATLYGVMFVSKYIIKEYAELVTATKKLRDARRL